MIVTFEQAYLRELYEEGKASDKKHRFQPQIVRKYTRTIDLMKKLSNVMGLAQFGGLQLSNHYKTYNYGTRGRNR
jgi:proteic killer suppression protein